MFVLSGPGGAGKSTLAARLVEIDSSLWLSRSWTTRPRRPNELATAYHFVTRDEFTAQANQGGFLETDEFLGNLYGTPTPDPPAGKDVLLEINLRGAQQVLARRADAVVIFVVPPSKAIQEARLRVRGDDDAHVARRLAIAANEEEMGTELAHAVVVNDDLDRAAGEVSDILNKYRSAKG